jgi:glycosyltransferase involved in cell wall biosynthesis
VPLVFTHHTMYEQYTHYVPGDSPALKRFVMELSTGYANLCDLVIAPSESVKETLCHRSVVTPIEVIPTGVDVERFTQGYGSRFRVAMDIPLDAFVVGHVGRLAPEKNLTFLAEAVCKFLRENDHAHFLVAGVGPSEADIRNRFEKAGMTGRLHIIGILQAGELADAYHVMDVFAFASQSETQGMVLTEAMAAGVPVVAVDASGVREVVIDGKNGRLLFNENLKAFSSALAWVASLSPAQRQALREAARETAECFSMPRCAARTLRIYESLLGSGRGHNKVEDSLWATALRLIETEWELWVNRAHAAGAALTRSKTQ